ncbi:hypothetical protein CGCSCA5_v014439 [Colletotrichum siamense]|nr:hypothetical protein CGCSCA5_v014439 [Colletotrichum siamense]
MSSSFPLKGLAGYTSRTVPFKVISDGTTINADVVYPETSDGSPAVVLLHYHGGFLASVSAIKKPNALLLIYGMLDPSGTRYTTAGKNIFDRPLIETGPILEAWPMRKTSGEDRKPVSAYPIGDPATDPKFALASALHIDAIFPDYMAGVPGLARQIAAEGITAVPEQHRQLFPLDFGNLRSLPPIMLLHGANDSAVPLECSTKAADKLEESGVGVFTEFPANAQHGFDARAGDVNIETSAGDAVIAVESLRKAIGFLEQHAVN